MDLKYDVAMSVTAQETNGASDAQAVKLFKTLELALYHNLGELPEPETAHRFF